jgi:hypothetical protein
VSEIPAAVGLQLFLASSRAILKNYAPLWLLCAAGLALTAFLKVTLYKKVFIYLFFIISFLTILPGLHFYGHYWLQLVPAAAILAGTALSTLKQLLTKPLGGPGSTAAVCCAFVALIGPILYSERAYYFHPDPTAILRRVYGSNPFPEAKVVGDFIAERSREGDKIALIGAEPEMYFYARRRAASRHADFSYLISNDPIHARLQEEFMWDVDHRRPRFFVVFGHPISLFGPPQSKIGILAWAKEVVKLHYRLIGYADMVKGHRTEYYWDDEVNGLKPKGRYFVAVYELK